MKIVELVNSTPQVITPAGFVVLGTVDKANVNYVLVGTTGIQINSPGYYELEWTADIESTTATTQYKFDILADGVPVIDAYVYGATVGPISTVSVSKVIRVYCNSASTVSIRNDGTTDATVNNSNFIIKRVA